MQAKKSWGMDPIELRLLNEPDKDPFLRSTVFGAAYRRSLANRRQEIRLGPAQGGPAQLRWRRALRVSPCRPAA